MIVVYMNSLLVISVSRSASFSLSLRVWVGEVGGEGSDCDAQYKPFFFCGNVFGDSYCCLYSNVSLILLFVHRLPDEGITYATCILFRECVATTLSVISCHFNHHTPLEGSGAMLQTKKPLPLSQHRHLTVQQWQNETAERDEPSILFHSF